MEKIEKQLTTCGSKWPYTSVMRNYFATSSLYSMRQTEWQRTQDTYLFGVQIFPRDEQRRRYSKPLFCIDAKGSKHVVTEECFKSVFDWLLASHNSYKTQGDEDAIAEDDTHGSKEENVIITGPEEDTATESNIVKQLSLLDWSSTENYYDFSGGFGSVMNRWFPLETIKIGTAYTPSFNGGLVKSWKIPEDLVKVDLNSANIIPLRIFMMGKLDIEFKLVLQANPFQACCVMMGTLPNPYGLFPKVLNWQGVKNDGSIGSTLKSWPYSFESGSSFTYADRDVTVQRPNTIIDVQTGGQGTLRVHQKYHKTLIRNFDASFVSNLNPGLRGAWSSNLTLHVITQLRVGSGSDNDFTARIFYRFIDTKVTGMSEAVSTGGISFVNQRAKTLEELNAQSTTQQKYTTQGPAMSLISTARGVVDVADESLKVVENFGTEGRKGFRSTLNRDKPNDTLVTAKIVPRPRSCFNNGVGIDDGLVMALGWNELVQFFETFEDEPKNFYEFNQIRGILDTVTWSKSSAAGSTIFNWTVHPTLKNTFSNGQLDTNKLRAPLSISSSCFTNYWGTIEMCFQFVKTDFHKGAVQVSIQFGKRVTGDALRSTYVKVLNIQECSAFKVTIPYIYDTPVRNIAGSVCPIYMPNLADPHFMKFVSSTIVTVKVLNELTCPTTVSSLIDVVVWIKGGQDYNLNFPRPMNTGTFITSNSSNLLLGTSNVRRVMSSNDPTPQYGYNINNGLISQVSTSDSYVVQGFDDDEEEIDFRQGQLDHNRNTNQSHIDFSDLLKIPIKILNNYEVSNKITRTFQNGGKDATYTLQNYFTLPVAPLSYSLIDYLNHQWYTSKSNVYSTSSSFTGNTTLQQSVQCQINSMFGMFRGSLVYTVVIVSSTAPIYCCYLPHDYNLRPLTGNLNVTQPIFNSGSYYATSHEGLIGMGEDSVVDLAQCFPGTIMIIPSVNPTERVIVPMSTQTNWLLMNRQLATEAKEKTGLITMRENQEWFNGHLCLWSKENFTFDLFINAGDDHKIGGFLGHHGLVNPWAQFAMGDNWRVQGLDFNIKEVTSKGWYSIKRIGALATGGVACSLAAGVSPPEIKPFLHGFLAFCAVGGAAEAIRIRNLLQQTTPAIEELNRTLTSSTVVEDSARIIMNVLKENFPLMNVDSSLMDKLWSASQHVVHSALSMNWKNAAFGVFCMVVKLELFSMQDWGSLGEPIINFFSASNRTEFSTEGPEDDTPWMAMCEVIATILGGKMQVKASGGLREYLREMFVLQNYRNVAGLNSVVMLIRKTLNSVSTIFNWLLEKKDPNVILLKTLHKQGSDIATFVEEASAYLNHFNDKDIKRKAMRVKYLGLIITAYKLREILLQIGNPKLSQQLLNLCNDVIKKAVKQRYLFQCDVIKSEPFVLCVAGDSKLGKSFSVYDLSVTGLQAIGVSMTQPDCIFTIPAGVDYWNGYDDQPIIWYDDWCNLVEDETIKQHIAQLYALKTSAPFNVPRAELENKEQIAAPNIIMMTTNNPFPQHPMIHFPKAVYRRRDMLVKFSLADGKESIDQFTQEQLKNFEHLEVQIYNDVTDPNSLSEQRYTYQEFKDMYISNLKAFHLKELNNKKDKYARLMQAVTKTTLDHIDIGNPFYAINQLNEEDLINKPTAEVLEQEVILLQNLIQKHAEILKLKIGDEEIFTTEGLIDDQENSYEHTFFRQTAPQKQTEQERYQEDSKTFMGKVRQWCSKVKECAMICERCGLEASSQGTAFYCQEHQHYLCMHCAMTLARPYLIERNSNDIYLDVSCPLHSTNIIVVQNGFFRSLLCSLMNMVVYQPIYIVKTLLNKYDQTDERKLLALVFAAKIIVLRLSYLLINKTPVYKFSVQGNEDETEEELLDWGFNGPISNTAYDFKETWKLEAPELQKFQQHYQKVSDGYPSNSKEGPLKYICPHSLLCSDYIFNSGNFFVEVESEMILIKDQPCSGKCVLTNLKFLELIKKKISISKKTIDEFNAGDVEVITQRFPKFTHTPEVQKLISRKAWITKIIRKDWWENYVCAGVGKAWEFIKRCLPVIAACTLVWIANRGFNMLWNWIAKVIGIQTQGLISSGATPTKSRKGARQKRQQNTYTSQSESENFDNKLNKISKNFVVIEVNGKKLLGWGLKNTTLLIPKHLGLFVKECRSFVLKFISDIKKGITFYASDCTFVEMPEKDLMQITLKSSPLFKDCTSFIPHGRQDMSFNKGVMIVVDLKEMNIYEEDVNILNYSNNFEAMNGEKTVYSRQVVMYDLQAKGMCGSLLCVNSNTPILAMHVAGSDVTGRGVGIPLNAEEYKTQGGACEIEDSEEDTAFYGEDCLIEYEASVSKDKVPFIPVKTTIMPSLIAQSLPEPVTRPAFLCKSEGYLWEKPPLYYGVRKNGFPPITFPGYYINLAFTNVEKFLLRGNELRKATVLSLEEAVCGFPQMVVDDPYNIDDEDTIYYGSLPLDTSAGYPYSTVECRKRFGITKTNKEEWIQIEYVDGYPYSCKIHQFVLDNYNTNMDLRYKGIMSENVFQDCLKDERRPLKKALSQGGTRLFSMSNVEGSIALRQFTLDLTSFLRYNRIKNGIGVGINPESMEWSILAETLLRNPNMFTTDFTNFGAGLDYNCGMMFAELVIGFYKQHGKELNHMEKTCVRTLLRELMASRHIAGNLIYGTHCGSPSGAAITVEINSFVHLLYIAICWLIVGDVIKQMCGIDGIYYKNLAQEYGDLKKHLESLKLDLKSYISIMTLDDYNHNVVKVVYGDDGIFSVSDKYKDVFNSKIINLILKDHHIGVTDATKQSEIIPYTTLDNVTFLKRNFVPHELFPKTLFMAKMNLDTVYECAKWIHKNELGSEVCTIENCKSSLMLAFGHGEKFYEEYREVLNGALRKLKLEEVQLTWMDMCIKFYPNFAMRKE